MTRRDWTRSLRRRTSPRRPSTWRGCNIRHLPVVDRRASRRDHLDPRHDELGGRGAVRRARDARHRAEPHGAVRRRASSRSNGARAPSSSVARRYRFAARPNGPWDRSNEPNCAMSRGNSNATRPVRPRSSPDARASASRRGGTCGAGTSEEPLELEAEDDRDTLVAARASRRRRCSSTRTAPAAPPIERGQTLRPSRRALPHPVLRGRRRPSARRAIRDRGDIARGPRILGTLTTRRRSSTMIRPCSSNGNAPVRGERRRLHPRCPDERVRVERLPVRQPDRSVLGRLQPRAQQDLDVPRSRADPGIGREVLRQFRAGSSPDASTRTHRISRVASVG